MTPEQYAEERIDILAEELAEILMPPDLARVCYSISYYHNHYPLSKDMMRFKHRLARKEV